MGEACGHYVLLIPNDWFVQCCAACSAWALLPESLPRDAADSKPRMSLPGES